MLREDKNARYESNLLRRWLVSGRSEFQPISRWAHRGIVRAQRMQPVAVAQDERRTWWMYRDRFFWEDEGLEVDEVQALLLDRERRRQRKIARAVDLMIAEEAGGPRREPIAEDLRREVFRRDGGQCVACGSAELLQFDHVIPVSLGGATTPENLQLLCADCNREKGASL